MPSPALRLERYFYERLILEANPEWPRNEPPGLGVRVNVQFGARTDDPKQWRVIMDVIGRPKEKGQIPTYRLRLRSVGFFTVDVGQGGVDEAAKLVQVTGTSILYSAARELVLMLTSRSQYGPVTLPTVGFMGLKTRSKRPDTDTPTGTDASPT